MKRQASLLAIIAFYAFVLLPLALVWAQDVTIEGSDITGPMIQHDPPEMGASAGKPLEILAVITDETAVGEVNLFYRREGDIEYFSMNMAPIGDDIFSAAIPKDNVMEPGLEYYILASDQVGNVAPRGFSSAPLVIMVTPFVPEMEEEVLVEAPQEEPLFKTEASKSKPWYKKWWVWTIASAVTTGTIYAMTLNGEKDRNSPGAGASTGTADIITPLP